MKRTHLGYWFAIAIGVATAIASAKPASPAEVAAGAAAAISKTAHDSKPPKSTHYDNAVIHVEVTGHGRPMLFLPGLTCPGEVYADAVARYAGRYECHVVSLGGFGGQPRYEGPFLDTARDALLDYLRQRELKSAVVVGHSLGGVLAMELAIAAPEAIGPVVVLDAVPFLGGLGQPAATRETARAQFEPMHKMIAAQTQEQYAAFQRQSPYVRTMVTGEENLARVIAWAAASDPRAVADGMMDVATTDLRPQIASIRSPLLVLGSWYGLKDYSTREAVEKNYRDQYASAPRWTFAMADTARHFLMLDAPDWTWSKVDEFLAANASKTAIAGGER